MKPDFRRPPSLARQRGASAVFMALVMIGVLVPLIALLINVGQLYYAQRQLEKLATIAALDAARVASGCSSTSGNTGIQGTLAATQAAVNTSLAANNVAGLTLLTSGATSTRVELGVYTRKGGKRVFSADTSVPSKVDSVRVTLFATQPTPLFYFGASSGLLSASASAQQAARGSFYLGTSLLSLSGGMLNQVLGGLLCAPGDTTCQNKIVSLDVLSSSSGLANVNVTLGQLATAAGVSVTDLSNPLTLNATAPGLKSLLNGLTTQLSGSVSSSVSTLLQNLANASTNPGSVPLGQLLGAVDSTAAAVPFVDLLDLIVALGQAATASNSGGVTPIALPVNVSVPGVATVSAFVQLISPPQFSGLDRAGTATAQSAQVTLLVRISAGETLAALTTAINSTLNSVLSLLGYLIGPVVTINVASTLNIGIDVALARSKATLNRLQCPVGGVNNGYPIASLSASPSIANVSIGTFSGSAASAPPLSPTSTLPVASVNIDATCLGVLHLICLANLGQAGLNVGLSLSAVNVGSTGVQSLADVTQYQRITTDSSGTALPVGTAPYYLALGGPAQTTPAATNGDNPQTVGSPVNVGLNLAITHSTSGSGLTGALVNLISGLLTTITNVLNSLVTLVNGLASSLVDPLLKALGIQLGTATVTMDAVEVAPPLLYTTCLPNDTSIQCATGP